MNCKKIGAAHPISSKSNCSNSDDFYCRSNISGYFTDDDFGNAENARGRRKSAILSDGRKELEIVQVAHHRGGCLLWIPGRGQSGRTDDPTVRSRERFMSAISSSPSSKSKMARFSATRSGLVVRDKATTPPCCTSHRSTICGMLAPACCDLRQRRISLTALKEEELRIRGEKGNLAFDVSAARTMGVRIEEFANSKSIGNVCRGESFVC
jgi:hypothetical protein